MKRLLSGRMIHAVTFGLITGLFSLFALRWHDLVKDAAARFDYIGVAVGCYGLSITIIEIARTKSAAIEARNAAHMLGVRMTKVFSIRNVIECRLLLERAIDEAHHDGVVGSSLLGRITSLYAREFSTSAAEADSPYRIRVGLLSTYIFGARQSSSATSHATRKLQRLMTEMLADLAKADSQLSDLGNFE